MYRLLFVVKSKTKGFVKKNTCKNFQKSHLQQTLSVPLVPLRPMMRENSEQQVPSPEILVRSSEIKKIIDFMPFHDDPSDPGIYLELYEYRLTVT
jgi:hypothetical protein